MSTIRAEVCVLEDVRPHPNADALNLGTVKGWQVCLKKDERKTGDPIVYFEAGTVLPAPLAERLGVTNYLSNKTDLNGDRVLVVGKVKLRGEPSFGLCIPVEDAYALDGAGDPEVGDDLADLYGVIKFRPPVKSSAGDADEDHPHFPAYTDIENLRNFPDILTEGEPVVIREKLHGTNCRVGFVADDFNNPKSVTWMAGSRELRRKMPKTDDEIAANTYWFPHALDPVKKLLWALVQEGHNNAVLYGEVYGGSVQKGFDYGLKRPGFRAFDLLTDGQYVDDAKFEALCEAHGVEVASALYKGPFTLEVVKQYASGPAVAGGGHIREGVVVTPAVERNHPQLGRVVLKYVSDAYLFRKGGDEDDTTDL